MGLLDAFKQYINDALPGGLLNPEAAQLPGLLNAQANATAQAIKAKGQSFKRGLDDPQKYAGEAFAAGMDMAGMAPLGLTVWHGSPHKFSKFDMSKIGTGEGAQAYGHGLYMADSPAVAKTYQDQLSKPTFIEKRTGKKISPQEQEWQDVLDRKFRMESNGYGEDFAKKYDMEVGGHLYKVDIPDEAVARMLDWDKKLSEQAPEVIEAIKKSSAKYGPVRGNAPIYSDAAAPYMTGHDFYRDLANALSDGGVRRGSTALSGQDAIASQHLRELGIPGIRYLDGGSRSAGNGSSNFVLFDDSMARILETNGSPTGLAPWEPGEFGLLSR